MMRSSIALLITLCWAKAIKLLLAHRQHKLFAKSYPGNTGFWASGREMEYSTRLAPTGVAFQPASAATVHADCPRTELRSDEVQHPSRFRKHIMCSSTNIAHFHRRDLMKVMIQCFESPFDPPRNSGSSPWAVRVELSSVPEPAAARLRYLASYCSKRPVKASR